MIAFDTLSAATRLRQEAGFSEDQARVLVDTFAQCVDESLATKRHVKETEEALRRDMQQLEASLRGDLEQTEASLRADLASLRADLASLRGDLEKTEASLRAEITGVRDDLEKIETSLRADMRALEHRMTIKLGGIVSLGLGILVALETLVF
ncbi:MAG: DUF1640 domain-containing protein [Gammaproteobacteria bacterium]|nr:DUF1640 domain-containing protein [Gammaproteobacteria bacterium]